MNTHEIKKYNFQNIHPSQHVNFINELSFSKVESDREKEFIKQICKKTQKSQTVIYTLAIRGKLVGVVSVSAASIDNQPAIQIDYIFISEESRGKKYTELDNTKPFRFLVEYIIYLALEFQEDIGIRYIILLPDTDDTELVKKYENLDFNRLNKEGWMFIKLK